MPLGLIKKGLKFGKNALFNGLSSPSGSSDQANSYILRYPYDIMDAETDYFLIEALEYKAGGTPNFSSSGGAFNKLKSAKSERNFILPVPNGIGSKNNIGWQGGNMNALTGAAAGAVDTVLDPKGLDGSENIFKTFSAGVTQAGEGLQEQLTNSSSDTTRIREYVKAKTASAVINAAVGSNINANQIMARQSGQIINQNLELLFNSVSLRPFGFRWDISPRDKKEAKVVKEMFLQLKMRSSPKRLKGGEMAFLSTPDVFRISYRKGGNVHPFLNKFKICALTSVGINYTGSGQYSTYPDGTPVHMKLDLAFTELEPIYRDDYEESYIDF